MRNRLSFYVFADVTLANFCALVSEVQDSRTDDPWKENSKYCG